MIMFTLKEGELCQRERFHMILIEHLVRKLLTIITSL